FFLLASPLLRASATSLVISPGGLMSKMGKEVRAGTPVAIDERSFTELNTEKGIEMKKTILVFLAVAALTLFGFACKNENNTNTTDTTATVSSETSATSSSTTM